MSELERIPQNQFDRIERYFLEGGGGLSEQDQEICKRLEVAFSLLLEHRQKTVVVRKMMVTLGGSESQCYRDIQLAERVFAPMRKYEKEFVRMITIESAMRDIDKAEKLAADALADKENPKHNLYKIAMAVKDRAEMRIIRASGLENTDPDRPDYSKLLPSTYVIDMPPVVKEYFKRIIAGGRVDMNKAYNDIVDAEILKHGDDSAEV